MQVMLGRCEVARNIETQLENIGIDVIIKEVSDSQYNYCLENRSYQILLTGVYNGFSPDVSYFYGNGNIANYNNDEVTTIVSEIKNITNQKLLEEKYEVVINKTKEDCPYISLYRNTNSLLINQNIVGNFEPNNYKIFYNFESFNRE